MSPLVTFTDPLPHFPLTEPYFLATWPSRDRVEVAHWGRATLDHQRFHSFYSLEVALQTHPLYIRIGGQPVAQARSIISVKYTPKKEGVSKTVQIIGGDPSGPESERLRPGETCPRSDLLPICPQFPWPQSRISVEIGRFYLSRFMANPPYSEAPLTRSEPQTPSERVGQPPGAIHSKRIFHPLEVTSLLYIRKGGRRSAQPRYIIPIKTEGVEI